jgi:hypothetical protein
MVRTLALAVLACVVAWCAMAAAPPAAPQDHLPAAEHAHAAAKKDKKARKGRRKGRASRARKHRRERECSFSDRAVGRRGCEPERPQLPKLPSAAIPAGVAVFVLLGAGVLVKLRRLGRLPSRRSAERDRAELYDEIEWEE